MINVPTAKTETNQVYGLQSIQTLIEHHKNYGIMAWWNEVAYHVVTSIHNLKFKKNPYLRDSVTTTDT